jgi:hypothetical protein
MKYTPEPCRRLECDCCNIADGYRGERDKFKLQRDALLVAIEAYTFDDEIPHRLGHPISDAVKMCKEEK